MDHERAGSLIYMYERVKQHARAALSIGYADGNKTDEFVDEKIDDIPICQAVHMPGRCNARRLGTLADTLADPKGQTCSRVCAEYNMKGSKWIQRDV